MPKRNDTTTIELLRQQNRERAKRYYNKHRDKVKKENLERYYENKRNLQDSEQN